MTRTNFSFFFFVLLLIDVHRHLLYRHLLYRHFFYRHLLYRHWIIPKSTRPSLDLRSPSAAFFIDPQYKGQIAPLTWETVRICILPAFIAAAAGAVEAVMTMEVVNDLTETVNEAPNQQLVALSIGSFFFSLFFLFFLSFFLILTKMYFFSLLIFLFLFRKCNLCDIWYYGWWCYNWFISY